MAANSGDELRCTRAWKLFLLLSTFNRGQWTNLLIMSQDCSECASQAQCRRRRTHQNDSLERRAECAEALVQIGELSAGRRALEGAPLAPGNMATLRELQNPLRLL